jgi:hypothetical protein
MIFQVDTAYNPCIHTRLEIAHVLPCIHMRLGNQKFPSRTHTGQPCIHVLLEEPAIRPNSSRSRTVCPPKTEASA